VNGRARAILTAVLLLAAAGSRGEESVEEVDRLFERWNRRDSPGGAVGVVQDGRIIHQKGYGMADLEHGIANSPGTVFNIGSLAKQFTAYAVAVLESWGRLRLDDDVRQIVPELPDYGKRISLGDLVHHRSGLRDYAMLMYLGGSPRDEYHDTQEVIREVLARQKALNFSPGERYEYSNSNYLLLGEVIRRVSGLSLREFCARNIFAPLGMGRTLFNDDAGRIIAGRACGYLQGEGGVRLYRDNNDLVGDGGLYASIEDLCLWEKHFQSSAGGDRAIRERILNRGREGEYAFGLEFGTYRGLPVVRHSGSYIGFGAMMVRFPQQRLAVVCLSNCDSLDARPMALRIARVFLGDRLRDENEAVAPSSLPAAELAEKCGAFRSPENMDLLVIRSQNGRLVCELNQAGAVAYAPLADGRFKAVEPDLPLFLRFLKPAAGARGAVQALTRDQLTNTFEPVELAVPSAADLAEYAGDYFSEELQARYAMVVEAGRLHVRFRRAPRRSPREPLRPTIADEFAAWPLVFRFFRDQAGRVAGFKLAPIGSEHIPFVKLDGASGPAGGAGS
jgi:CubicO group peptidase (beta-lactamase class C family)